MTNRFDTLPLDQVATLDGTRCYEHTQCRLIAGHEGPCADVSPAGLVHEVLPEQYVTGKEFDALNQIKEAYNAIHQAMSDADDLTSELLLAGPNRIKTLIAKRRKYLDVEYLVPDDPDEWPEDLANFGDPS